MPEFHNNGFKIKHTTYSCKNKEKKEKKKKNTFSNQNCNGILGSCITNCNNLKIYKTYAWNFMHRFQRRLFPVNFSLITFNIISGKSTNNKWEYSFSSLSHLLQILWINKLILHYRLTKEDEWPSLNENNAENEH